MPKVSTPTPRVNLRKQKATDKNGFLFLTFRTGGKTLSYPTGYKVEARYFDTARQRTKFNKKHGQTYIDINTRLDELTKFVNDTYRANTDITTAELRAELDYHTGKRERPRTDGKKRLSFFEFIELYINEKDTDPTVKKPLVYRCRSVYNHLKAYAAEQGKPLDFADIDWEFKALFERWLFAEPRQFSQAHAAKILKITRTFLNDATRRGYNTNTTYQQSGFSIKTEKTKNKIRLTFAELEQLIKHDFSDNDRLAKVRDLFVVGAFTGLRFSDWSKLNRANITEKDGYKFFEVRTLKTGAVVLIPVLPELTAVLERYNYQLPVISSQKFNQYIKEVCEKAGIDTLFLRVYSEAGKTLSERVPKWTRASSHAARRSFASNFHKLGVPASSLMQVTGHTTEKQFFEYIDISQTELAVNLAKQIQLLRSPLSVVSQTA